MSNSPYRRTALMAGALVLAAALGAVGPAAWATTAPGPDPGPTATATDMATDTATDAATAPPSGGEQDGDGPLQGLPGPVLGTQPPDPLPTTTATPSQPSAEPTETAEPVELPPLDVETRERSVRPGRAVHATAKTVPEGFSIAADVVRTAPADGGPDPSPCDATAAKTEGHVAVTCDIPADWDWGTYVVRVRLLDQDGEPVLDRDGNAVEADSDLVFVIGSETYSPGIELASPAVEAGKMVQLTGSGFAPTTRVLVYGPTAEGTAEQREDVFFSSSIDEQAIDDTTRSLAVETDEKGEFTAFVGTSPYAAPESLLVAAQDTTTDVVVTDRLTLLGAERASLRPETLTSTAGAGATVEVSGAAFAPHFKGYPLEVRLVGYGSASGAVATGTAEVKDGVFSAASLTVQPDTPVGVYYIEALAPTGDGLPESVRGRVLARAPFAVLPAVGSGSPTNPPGDPDATPDGPEPVTPAAPVAPPVSLERVPAEQAPERAVPRERPSAPAARQLPLQQNPAWLQTTAVRADDPLLESGKNEELKSSVLRELGGKALKSGVEAESGETSASGEASEDTALAGEDGPSAVAASEDRPVWPFVLFGAVVLIGLCVGLVVVQSARKR
ncbi:hypothetical protein [Arthrobacter sp. L77]|uniref:hypothetical protein n=1 Tax=Arthrobacter sp. L77 TaxID=1496689 RepID=UPI0005BAFE6A|nr:hypothetical protein [Arthrobacter sp. L77]